MIRLRPHLAAAAALVALAQPAPAQGQTAEEILRTVGARARTRMQGVQNYTVNIKTMGQSVVSYASRGPDGAFHVQAGGTGEMAGMAAEMTGWADELLLMFGSGLAENSLTSEDIAAMTYGGVVNSLGAPAYRISASFNTADGTAEVNEAMPRRMVLDVDTATLLTRRMEVEMATGQGTPGSILMEFSDWRTVGGMLFPFRRHMVIRGIRAEVLGADTASGTQLLAQWRARLAELPEARREEMRQMLEVMEGLVKRDEMVLDEIVTSVAVNQGPPAGITFAPHGLDP
jgi:hypothetical protein